MKNIIETMSQKNILQLLINCNGISRAQIARETGLNRSTVSYIVKDYIELGYIYESTEKILTGGRASNLLFFNYDYEKILLIDLQSSKIKFYLCNLYGDIIDVREEEITDHTFANFTNRVLHHLAFFPNVKIIGLSIHGIVSAKKSTIISPFYNYNYKKLVEFFNKNNYHVLIENESNIQTQGIFHLKGNKVSSILNIHIKDGIGAGIILNGKLYRGANGYAGEIGHSIAQDQGKRCRCGNYGCLEQYSSETALINNINNETHLAITNLNIDTIISNNPLAYKQYLIAFEKLACKINDLLLFTNVDSLYITSNLYCSISSFKSDLISSLSSQNIDIPKIYLLQENQILFTHGFAQLILDYKINNN